FRNTADRRLELAGPVEEVTIVRKRFASTAGCYSPCLRRDRRTPVRERSSHARHRLPRRRPVALPIGPSVPIASHGILGPCGPARRAPAAAARFPAPRR